MPAGLRLPAIIIAAGAVVGSDNIGHFLQISSAGEGQKE